MKSTVLIAISGLLLLGGCTRVLISDPTPTGPHPHAQVAAIGIPPGHFPPPGQCRVWIPGRPPGHQPPPGPCSVLAGEVPPGAWLVSRPSKNKRNIKVSFYHERRPGIVVAVGIYDVATGKLVQESDG